MITAENLSKNFSGKEIISHVSFSLRPNTITALLGMNGAGKTTTLHMLAGILKPNAGRVVLRTTVKDVRKEIGFLPQYPAFHGWMSAREYVTMAGELSGLSRVASKERAEEVLVQTGLSESENQRISEFSGGMKQRLGIAQAIIHRPKLLLLDEPVSALDPQGRKDVIMLLSELKKTTTILYSTHILHDAEQLADDVLMMHKGKVVAFESLTVLLQQSRREMVTVYADEPLYDWGEQLRKRYPVWTIHIQGAKADIEGPLSKKDMQGKVMESLVENAVTIRSLTAGEPSLDELFNEVIERV